MNLQDHIKLLHHMLEHSKEHLEELQEMEKNFRELGKEEAAEQIRMTVGDYSQGNTCLASALELMGR